MSLLGRVIIVDPKNACFVLRCRSEDEFLVQVGPTTTFTVLENMDDLSRDRVPTPPDYKGTPEDNVLKYIQTDALIALRGIYIEHGTARRLDARSVTLLMADQGQFVFEDTHWWLTQIARFADQWLDDLFQDRRSYEWDDFARLYRTNLNILGQPTDDNIQECATLSRLIYGLSSCYLLTGGERYLLAARAGVKYQKETFRSLSHDGKYCFWMFGKRKHDRGAHLIFPSENPDDQGTIPLYEQIYALAGLCQYYRITQDWEVLEDIRRTIRAFQDFYRDDPQFGYTGTGGYFSHIDYATLRPDVDALGPNKLRKNWNSIGDHIPAYLVNLILALDPLPRGTGDHDAAQELLDTCRGILAETSQLILKHFPDSESQFVNERFHADWTPDHQWGWQQNRAIVGHNLKIAWNLTRVANQYRTWAEHSRVSNGNAAREQTAFATELERLAAKLADDMATAGIDQLRGGCFDAVERQPSGGMPIEFAWENTKDFWQQEQAILAYLIVYGTTRDAKHLQLAREMMAFWNLYFLDHDNRGVFFRVTADGNPVIQGTYSQKAGHSVAGYHSFELNYLAHTYICTYVQPKGHVATMTGDAVFPVVDQNFCLFFRPEPGSPHRTLNVLPDFLPPGAVEITNITVNGVKRPSFAKDNFQIELEEDDMGGQIIVEFCPKGEQR
jgi:mannose/cellobiose epimerase-like protein (N-acyl-D-glucosamine 2-epimerase family)